METVKITLDVITIILDIVIITMLVRGWKR